MSHEENATGTITTARKAAERYALTLRAEPRAGDPDGTRRLRALLKRLLRGYGFRCTRIDVIDPQPER